MKIALDAMGGDFGPLNLVAGAVMALRDYPHIEKLFLVGDTKQIESELKKQVQRPPDRHRACDSGRGYERQGVVGRAAKERFVRQPRG